MKRKIIASLPIFIGINFLSALFIQPAFANHGLEAMGDGIMLAFLFGILLVLISIASVIVSYFAYRRNKTSLKIISTILSTPVGVSAIVLLNFNFVLAIVPIAIVITNMLLIANAKTQTTGSANR